MIRSRFRFVIQNKFTEYDGKSLTAQQHTAQRVIVQLYAQHLGLASDMMNVSTLSKLLFQKTS